MLFPHLNLSLSTGLSPELKVSEEHDENFAYNKVTFRIEEMIGFVAKDLNAMVKVTF